jgi:hypothetical protein
MRTVAARPSRTVDPGTAVDGVVTEGLKAARSVAEAADATVKGAVERGVETAYRVFEEYMRRGQIAAESQNDLSNGRNGMTNYRQYPGPWDPTMSLMAPWWQLMQMWASGVAAFVPGGAALTNAFDPWWGRPAPGPRARLAVLVKSKSHAEVTVDLHPGAECHQLRAELVA